MLSATTKVSCVAAAAAGSPRGTLPSMAGVLLVAVKSACQISKCVKVASLKRRANASWRTPHEVCSTRRKTRAGDDAAPKEGN